MFQIEADTVNAEERSSNLVVRIRDLRERLNILKRKFKENEISVQRAGDEAMEAEDLANKAENVSEMWREKLKM